MENWAEEINIKIDKNLESVRKKDIRFYRVDEFKRNIKRVNDFSSNCVFCHKQKINISEATETIYEAIQVPGKSRREYDRLISRLAKHIRKEHGFYAPYYFSYLFSFFGLVAGILLGFLLSLFFPGFKEVVFSGTFMIAIIITYVIGSKKDKKVRSAKKLM